MRDEFDEPQPVGNRRPPGGEALQTADIDGIQL